MKPAIPSGAVVPETIFKKSLFKLPTLQPQRAKVFCFFFSKKKAFLPVACLWTCRRPGIGHANHHPDRARKFCLIKRFLQNNGIWYSRAHGIMIAGYENVGHGLRSQDGLNRVNTASLAEPDVRNHNVWPVSRRADDGGVLGCFHGTDVVSHGREHLFKQHADESIVLGNQNALGSDIGELRRFRDEIDITHSRARSRDGQGTLILELHPFRRR
jgi:hypothetical protein